MQLAANTLRGAALYGQLHTSAAGAAGTSNLTTAARQAITWAATSGLGNFGLASPINFTGGAASGPVYSITLWSASTAGTFYGELPLTGDTAFNASGQYNVTALDMTGTAT